MSASASHDATSGQSGQDVAIDHSRDRLTSAIRRHPAGRHANNPGRLALAAARRATLVPLPRDLAAEINARVVALEAAVNTVDPEVEAALLADQRARILPTDDLMDVAIAFGVAR